MNKAINLTGLKNKLTPDEAFNEMLGFKNDKVKEIDINLLDEITDQPFKPYTDEKLEELADDIKLNGLLAPLVVRPLNGRYQILAGRNRYNACKLNNFQVIDCIIKDVDDDEANLILVNSNLNQRQELLHSEKAFAYKMQYDAMKTISGQRTDLGQNLSKVNTTNQIAKLNNESQTNIKNYIRLTGLIKPFLNLVDLKELPFTCGVNISFVPQEEQEILYIYITEKNIKIDLKLSEKIKQLAKENNLNIFQLENIFLKPIKPKKNISIKFKNIEKYIDISKDEKDIEEYILKAIEFFEENKDL